MNIFTILIAIVIIVIILYLLFRSWKYAPEEKKQPLQILQEQITLHSQTLERTTQKTKEALYRLSRSISQLQSQQEGIQQLFIETQKTLAEWNNVLQKLHTASQVISQQVQTLTEQLEQSQTRWLEWSTNVQEQQSQGIESIQATQQSLQEIRDILNRLLKRRNRQTSIEETLSLDARQSLDRLTNMVEMLRSFFAEKRLSKECPNCSTLNFEGANYCMACGHLFQDPDSSFSPP